MPTLSELIEDMCAEVTPFKEACSFVDTEERRYWKHLVDTRYNLDSDSQK